MFPATARNCLEPPEYSSSTAHLTLQLEIHDWRILKYPVVCDGHGEIRRRRGKWLISTTQMSLLSSGTFAVLSLVHYHRVACTRKRPQAHPRDRVPPPNGKVDLRLRVEERKDELAKTSRVSEKTEGRC
jgi:hypothetical protein